MNVMRRPSQFLFASARIREHPGPRLVLPRFPRQCLGEAPRHQRSIQSTPFHGQEKRPRQGVTHCFGYGEREPDMRTVAGQKKPLLRHLRRRQ